MNAYLTYKITCGGVFIYEFIYLFSFSPKHIDSIDFLTTKKLIFSQEEAAVHCASDYLSDSH